jgi:cation:H+ antiporter
MIWDIVWIEFLISAALITYAATQLAKYGDAIAIRTRMGGMLVGMLLLAGATSLPEVLTTISALYQGVPDLAAGNLFGSNMFNMFMLAILDLVHYKHRILRKAAMKHALSGSLTVLMIALAVFFIMADLPLQIGWVGADSLGMILVYFLGMSLIQAESRQHAGKLVEQPIPEGVPTLRRGVIGFGLAALALVIVTPWMVSSSAHIAEITGLGATFVGTTLVAIVTSLPELVTTIAAARMGADDMAIGNLFGSNMFNMFALGLTDLFFLQGRFLSVIDPSFLVVGMIGLLMTVMGLIGNLARLERRFLFVELDALALMLTYVAATWLLYSRSIVP